MTLDTRANRASRSINQAVSGSSPVAMKAVVGRRRRSVGAGLVGALAALFASVALAATLPVFDSTDAAHQADGPVVDAPVDGPILHRAVTDSPEPYALFSGVNEPGTIVTAASEFGSADLVVGESGEWVLKVFFSSPPPGEEFPIVLTVGDQVFTFGFTSLWDPDAVDITAHQAFGVSDDARPFAKYYGTAPPGTVASAVSEFGSADTTAGDEGHWELGLWFEGARSGEAFPVTVTVGDEVFHFTFVWLQPGEGEGGEEIEVTAAQVNTTSNSPNPYTKFIGTAPQGTHVLATSEYGAADLEVGESGEFELKLFFSPLPPAGHTFPIILKIDGDVYGEYHFTSYYEPAAAEVTVHQYNTASDDPYPWVKFYGTAPKGAQIQILSPYGSWSWNTEAVEWNSGPRYFSPMPPPGETFDITVKVDGETFGVYPFTSWFDGDQVIIEVVKTAAEGPEPYTRIEYWAPAGTTIKLISDYGTAAKTVAETGGGDMKLWFSPLPPAGVPFTVTIKVNGDVWDTYQFTSYYEETSVTVNHAYNSCNLDPPYDDLWGTAPAGTQIKILSEYGSSTFTVGESGSWEKRQHFEGAPYGVPFTVTVKVNGETHTTYQFTVNEPEA